jgi:hypothetical protein
MGLSAGRRGNAGRQPPPGPPWRFFVAALALVPLACVTLGRAPAPTGALALAGPAFGTQHLVPSACRAGGHQAFYGVDLRDEAAGIVTRVVIDPIQGGVVRLFPASAPAEPGLVFRRADCETFRVEVAATGTQVNLVDEMRVALALDCRGVNGDWLRGELSWDGCR